MRLKCSNFKMLLIRTTATTPTATPLAAVVATSAASVFLTAGEAAVKAVVLSTNVPTQADGE